MDLGKRVGSVGVGALGVALSCWLPRPAIGACLDLPDFTVTRGTGDPEVVQKTFAQINLFAVPALQVDNGLPDGTARCSAAVVTLNGTVVFGTSSFGQQVGIGRLSAPITLQGQNTLQVELDSAPGCQVTVRIVDLDATTPQVVVQAPEPGAVFHPGDEVATWGTVDDPSAKIAANGVPCLVSGTTFTCRGYGLARGENWIDIVATDACGNTSDAYVPVLYADPSPTPLVGAATPLTPAPADPPVCYDFPQQTVVVNRPAVVSQQWTFADPNPDGAVPFLTIVNGLPNGSQKCARGTVLLNGATIVTSKQFAGLPGLITAPVSLYPTASNTLAVQNLSGKPSCQLQISIQDSDTTPPVVTVYVPTQNELFCPVDSITAQGFIDDRTATLFVNGAGCPHLGHFFGCAGFPLATTEGQDSIVFAVTDYCGNTTASMPFSITVDESGPTLQVTAPPVGYVSCSTNPVQATGGASDATDVTVRRLDDNTVVTSGTPSLAFSFSSTFYSDGPEVIGVGATDACGTQTTAYVPIFEHATPPSIAVTSPLDGGWSCSSLVNVGGTYSGNVSRITVNGVDAAFGAGAFNASLVATGPVTINAVASDEACLAAGFEATSSVSFLAGAAPNGGVCGTLGPSGGEVNLASGAGVIIPPGALGTTTTIWVIPAPGTLLFPRHLVQVGDAFEVGPTGLVFAQPVTVAMPISTPVTAGIGLDYRAFAKEEAATFMGEIPTSAVDLRNYVLYGSTRSLSIFAPAFALSDFSPSLQLSDPQYFSFRSRPTVSRSGAEMMAYINTTNLLNSFTPVERTWDGSAWTPEVSVGPAEGYPYIVENTVIEMGVGADGSELPFYFFDVERAGDGSVGEFSTFYAGGWSTPTQLPWGYNQLSGWSPLMVFDSAGAWHAFFQDFTDFYYGYRIQEAESTDQGATWFSPITTTTNPYIPGTAGLVQGLFTSVATGDAGEIYLLLGNSAGTGLYYVGSADYGQTWGQVVSLSGSLTGYTSFPSIAKAPGNVLHILWGEGPVGGGFNNQSPPGQDDIYYERCTAPVATTIYCASIVNLSNSPTHSRDPKLEVDKAGAINVEWEEIDRSQPGFPVTFLYAFSGDEGATFSTPIMMPPFQRGWGAQEWDGAVDGSGNLRIGYLDTVLVDAYGDYGWQIFETHLPGAARGVGRRLIEVSGNGAQGCPGIGVIAPLITEVQDAYGDGVSGAPVTFSVLSGAARLNGVGTTVTVATDVAGHAEVMVSELSGTATIGATAATYTIPLYGAPVTFVVNESLVADLNEPNNTFFGASGVAIPSIVQGTIAPPGDVDWFAFQLNEPGIVTLVLDPPPPDSKVSLSLVDSTGVTIASTQAYTPGAGVTLQGPVTEPGSYYVELYDTLGTGDCSAPYSLSFWTTARPYGPVPTGLVASPGTNFVVLEWSSVQGPGFINYNLYRGLNSGGPFTLVGTSAVASFVDVGPLSADTQYFYVVTAVYANLGESAQSSVVSAVPGMPGCSGPTPVPAGQITSDTAWTACAGPFLVNGEVDVVSGATLTIGAAVEVEFAPGVTLAIGKGSPGALVVTGAEVAPVIFTSEIASPTVSQSWRGILFENQALDGNSLLSNAVIENGGGTASGLTQGEVEFKGASPLLSTVTVRGSTNHGVLVAGGSPVLYGMLITGNAGYGVYHASASAPAAPRIQSSVIEHGYRGGPDRPSFKDVTFANYGSLFPMDVAAGSIVERSTNLAFDATSAIVLEGDTLTQGGVLPNFGMPYVVAGTVGVSSSFTGEVAVLQIPAGETLEFKPGTSLVIGGVPTGAGGLDASGVAFEGWGGGPWGGIVFGPQSQATVLDSVYVLNATGGKGAITLQQGSNVTVENSRIIGGGQCGIEVEGTRAALIGNLITDSVAYGICGAPTAVPAPALIQGNIIGYSAAHSTPPGATLGTGAPPDYGIYGNLVGASVFGNSVSHNIYITASGPMTMSGNTFTDYARNPAQFPASSVGQYFRNTILGAAPTSPVYVLGDTVGTSVEWGPINGIANYVVEGPVYVQGLSAPLMTLDPGVSVLLTSQGAFLTGITQPGGFVATNTSFAPVTSGVPWGGITFGGVALGGSGLAGSSVTSAGVVIYGSAPFISGCTIAQSPSYGISVTSGAPALSNNTIVDSRFHGIYSSGSLVRVYGSKSEDSFPLVISGNTVSFTSAHLSRGTTDYGIYFATGSPTNYIDVILYENTVAHNLHFSAYQEYSNQSIYQPASTVAFSENTFKDYANYPLQVMPNDVGPYFASGNAINGTTPTSSVTVVSGNVVSSQTWPSNGGMPYIVTGDIYVGNLWQSDVPILTIAPGASLYFAQGIELITNYNAARAALYATGVTFQALPGAQWRGLNLNYENNGPISIIQDCLIVGGLGSTGTLNVNQSSPLLLRNTILNTPGPAIALSGTYMSSPTISGNYIRDPAGPGIYMSNPGSPMITRNAIVYTAAHSPSTTHTTHGNVPYDYGILFTIGSRPQGLIISGNTVDHGIAFDSSYAYPIPTFSGNIFSVSPTYPPILSPDVVGRYYSSNTVYGLPATAFIVTGGLIGSDATWASSSTPYIIQGDIDVGSGYAPPVVTWTLLNGANLYMDGALSSFPIRLSISQAGALVASNANFWALDPTSPWDSVHAYGGSVPRPLVQSSIVSGTKYYGLNVQSIGLDLLDSLITPAGGQAVYLNGNGASIGTIVGNVLEGAQGAPGLTLNSAGEDIFNNTITSTGPAAVVVTGAPPTVLRYRVYQNSITGIPNSVYNNLAGYRIDARLNWLGGSDPQYVSSVTHGLMAVSPWLMSNANRSFRIDEATLTTDDVTQNPVGFRVHLSAPATAWISIVTDPSNLSAPVLVTGPVSGQDVQFYWNGTYSNGNIVANGPYYYEIQARSSSDGSLADPAIGVVSVNRKLPVAQIVLPADGSGVIGSAVTIAGQAYVLSGTGAFSYTIQYGAGTSPLAWTVIGSCTTSFNHGCEVTAPADLLIGRTSGSSSLSLVGLSGVYTTMLTVTNNGASSTAYTHFTVFGVSNATANPRAFSPGRSQTTTLTASTAIQAPWGINVSDRTFSGSAPPISAIWDGKNALNAIVTDGVYPFTVTVGYGGAVSTVTGTVTVDSTAPLAAITAPVGLTVNSSPATIYVFGTANDPNLASWELDYGQGTSPQVWTRIDNRYTTVAAGLLTTWNWVTQDPQTGAELLPDGPYTLLLSAVDNAGNTTTATKALTLNNLTISDVSAIPELFDPSAAQSTSVSLVLNRGATVTLQFYVDPSNHPLGSPVKSMIQNCPAPGTCTFIWDGTNSSAAAVSDEAYMFTLAADDGQGGRARYVPPVSSYGTETVLYISDCARTFPENRFNPFTNHGLQFCYNVSGRPIRTLFNAEYFIDSAWSTHLFSLGPTVPGTYTGYFDGYDPYGQPVSAQSTRDTEATFGGPYINAADASTTGLVPIGSSMAGIPLHENVILTTGLGTIPPQQPPGANLPVDYPPGISCSPALVVMSYGQFASIRYSLPKPANVTLTLSPSLPDFSPAAVTVGCPASLPPTASCWVTLGTLPYYAAQNLAQPAGPQAVTIDGGLWDLPVPQVMDPLTAAMFNLSSSGYAGDFWYWHLTPKTQTLFGGSSSSFLEEKTLFWSFQDSMYRADLTVLNPLNFGQSDASCAINVRE